MARIKVKPFKAQAKPALTGQAPDLDSIKKKIAEMVLMHHAVKARKMKNSALAGK